MNFINKIQRFMYGRYGVDNLTRFLFYLYVIFIILNMFLSSYILFIIELILIAIMSYRTLSKKIYKRSNENAKFMKIVNAFKSKPKNTDSHIYKRCHYCRRVLRLPIPSKKGIKHVKCPDCHRRNTFLILKSEKIEIIKNKK